MKWLNNLSLHWHVIWDIFLHYFDFEGKNVTTPQYITHFLSRSYKRRSTKSCTRVHAYWPYAVHWGDLYLLDISRNFCTWAHLGTPQAQLPYDMTARVTAPSVEQLTYNYHRRCRSPWTRGPKAFWSRFFPCRAQRRNLSVSKLWGTGPNIPSPVATLVQVTISNTCSM